MLFRPFICRLCLIIFFTDFQLIFTNRIKKGSFSRRCWGEWPEGFVIPCFFDYALRDVLSVAATAAATAVYDESCDEESPEAVVIHTHDVILLIFM